MRRRDLMGLALGATVVPKPALAQPTVPATAPVLTRSYDNSRSGWNKRETILTQNSVATRGIRKTYSLQMEGDARGGEAQILVVPNVQMRTGFRHDVSIQASMSDGVWAFDANTGEVLWSVKLGRPIKGDKTFDMYQINDNWGILGTPVIDPDTLILYCVAWSSVDRTRDKARYYAHALHVADGSPAATPLELTNATFDPGHGLPKMTLGTVYRKQRSALLLVNKTIVVTFAAGAESANTNHGWVLALTTSPFKIAAVWNNSPRYQGGGIWMGGQGPAADASGNIYFTSGNGAFDGVTEFGETITRLTRNVNTLGVTQWFTPYTDSGRAGLPPDHPIPGQSAPRPSAEMLRMPEGDAPVNDTPDAPKAAVPEGAAQVGDGWTDQDAGSAGLLLVPRFNLVIACGKDGIVWVLDMNAMGNTKLSDFSTPAGIAANYAKAKYIGWFTYFPGWDVSPTPTDLTKLNIDFAQRTHHQHSTPVYYESPVNGPTLFTGGENGPIRVWAIGANGVLTYLAQSDEVASPNAAVPPGGMTGVMMTVSSNGSAQNTGVLVAIFPIGNANKEVTDGFFVVYDAEHFDTRPDGSKKLRPLWRSSDWNIQFKFNKFNNPVVTGGKVFIPNYEDSVDVYQLA